MGKRRISFDIWWPERPHMSPSSWRFLIPHPPTLILTLLLVAGLIWAQSVGALPTGRPSSVPAASSASTIAYQGRLADAAGSPLTGTYNMIFRLYSVSSGGTPLWEEQWTGPNGVRVSDGLFNVMLGSLTPIPQTVITGHDQLFLGITVGTDDEMGPRVQLGSVPFATQALTVPDGSVTTAKIADGAVTQAKLGADVSMVPPDGSITTVKLADGAVTQAKIADRAVTANKLSRQILKAVAASNVSLLTPSVFYDVLSLTFDIQYEVPVMIIASVGVQNNQEQALFTFEINVDGNRVARGDTWAVHPGIGEQRALITTVTLAPGQHQVRLRASSWQANGFVDGDDRTQLIVIVE